MADLPDTKDLSAISDKAELLAELRELQVPTVSSWPALGWWLLLVLVVVCAALLLIKNRVAARRRSDAWREEALTQLNRLEQDLNKATDVERHRVVRDSSVLLRKVMIYVNGRHEVAALTDEAWLDALHGHETVEALEPELRGLLTDAPYESAPSAIMSESNVTALLNWMKSYVIALPRVSTDDR